MKLSYINKNGTLPKEHSSLITKYMRKTKGKLITIEYKAVKATRSLLQNQYYWGVVIDILSKEIGYEPEVMHDYMKKLTLGYNHYDMPDGYTANILRSTTELTTVEFENYCLAIRTWAGEFLNVFIPLPNETSFNYYEVK